MAVKVPIIYYTAAGSTHQLARALEEGAREAGVDVRFRKVHELAPEAAIASDERWSGHRLDTQDVEEGTLDDLRWADAMIFGTPTHCGLPTAQFLAGRGE